MDFTNIGTSIFATGMGVTILTKIKDICGFINKYLKIGYSIHTSTDGNRQAYMSLYKYIQTLQSKSIQKRLSFDADYYDNNTAYDMPVVTTSLSSSSTPLCNYNYNVIGTGTYLVFSKWNQIITITATTEHKQNINRPNHILTLNIIGYQAKKLHKQISEYIYNDLTNDKQFIGDREYSFETEKRTFDTIYHQNKNQIIKFLNTFKANKQIYINNGLAYKTGILLYGPPGTGKTSVIKAIAAYMNYDIYIVNPYQKLCSWEIRQNSVIVFEDIDKILTTQNSDEQNNDNNIVFNSLQPIMQLLDGLYSKDNIIFIATTNHIELLPPELIRSGRFDCKIELSDIPKNIAEEMCQGFNVVLSDIVPKDQSYPINPAYLQQLILNKIIQ